MFGTQVFLTYHTDAYSTRHGILPVTAYDVTNENTYKYIHKTYKESKLPDESKSSAFSGVSISGYVDITNFTTSFEHTPQIFRRCAVRKIVHFQRHHAVDTRRRPSVTHLDLYL